MFDDTAIANLCDSLRQHGRAVLTDAEGKRLVLVTNRLLGIETAGVLIAYEGRGSLIYEFGRPLNKFRLVTAGYPLGLATTLADLVTRVIAAVGESVTDESPAKALNNPLKE